jgi:hypothetical protein
VPAVIDMSAINAKTEEKFLVLNAVRGVIEDIDVIVRGNHIQNPTQPTARTAEVIKSR